MWEDNSHSNTAARPAETVPNSSKGPTSRGEEVIFDFLIEAASVAVIFYRSNGAFSFLEEHVIRPLCYGNACPRCGKCYDWHYDGDIDRDYDRYCRSESYDVLHPKRWHRRPNGPSVRCSYFSCDHFGARGARNYFDICRCE